jgi:hypothetical protein
MLFALVGGSNAVIKLGELVMILDRTCVESLWWPDLREISNLNRLVEGCISKFAGLWGVISQWGRIADIPAG